MPIACRLSDPELRKREATLLSRFKSAVLSTEELPDEYVFRILGDKEVSLCSLEMTALNRELREWEVTALAYSSCGRSIRKQKYC